MFIDACQTFIPISTFVCHIVRKENYLKSYGISDIFKIN